ncbi:MAG: DUF1552 domain-containing protein [Planctomycetes bacterium]|nr:DUF1552 domain-containing protein [Planctomycetota bacterium]MCP4860847.1 DUF1552 domain-containing protein [Planctomycetota bacterium]
MTRTTDSTRRHFLKASGVLMALPFMESLSWATTRQGKQPPRLLYVYMPNGVHIPAWMPKTKLSGQPDNQGHHGLLPETLPPSLKPLEEWRSSFSLLTGLTADKARANGDGPGDHARAAAAYLTGVQPKKADGAVLLGKSADQIAADYLGQSSPFRSLQLGCEPAGNAGECDSGYACAYSGNISWQNETTPTTKEIDPRKVFDRLFRNNNSAAGQDRLKTFQRRKSILDAIRNDAKTMAAGLTAEDRHKLEEYLTGIRELERRLQLEETKIETSVADDQRPTKLPKDFKNHIKLLIDMLALAFQTDMTRVATLMFGNEGSNRRYLEIGVPGGHHSATHHKGETNLIKQVCSINTLHSKAFGYLLNKFSETHVDGQPILNSTAVIYGSGIADGNRHDHHALPILLAGGQDLGIKPGQLREYKKNTPIGNLHQELLRRLQVPATQLGDATGFLPGLDS